MAKVVDLKMETLVDLFSKNEQEHNLLNEVISIFFFKKIKYRFYV